MKHIDLTDRIVPNPSNTLVVQTPAGKLVLVRTDKSPKKGDKVLVGDRFMKYRHGLQAIGVAYCIVSFL